MVLSGSPWGLGVRREQAAGTPVGEPSPGEGAPALEVMKTNPGPTQVAGPARVPSLEVPVLSTT